MIEKLSGLDILVIVIFLLVTTWLSRSRRGQPPKQNGNEFLLMSRGLTLPLFIATLTSTWYGGIFGVTQIAYEKGIYSFFTQGLFWYLPYAFFAIFLVKRIRQFQVSSLPELLGAKYGPTARKYSALVIFCHALPVTYGICLGVLINMLFGWHYLWGMSLGVTLVAGYCAVGGFRAIVKTDAWQFVFMFVAVISLTVATWSHYGGWDFLQAHLPKSHFDWRGDSTLTAVIWLLIASSSTLVHPVFYQRCLAAKSDKVAITGIFIAMACWLVFDICTTVGGLYARAILPHAPSEQAYFLLGLELMPTGLRGLFVAGIAATILSTLDSFLFISATSLSYDFMGSNQVHTHRVSIVVSSVILVGLAMIFGARFEAVWYFMESVFSVCLVVPTLVALFIKQAFSGRTFLFASILSLLTFLGGHLWLMDGPWASAPFLLAHSVAIATFLASKVKDQAQTKLAVAANL
jgi:SSS family solute:Na+ symporter